MNEELQHMREQIEALLREVYTEEGVVRWMIGRNRSLANERPTDLIAFGEGERVLQRARELAETTYA